MKKLFVLALSFLLLFAFHAISEVYVFDATNDLSPLTQGEKNDGDKTAVNDFFTIIHSQKNKIDSSTKNFDDGYYATQRLNFGGKTQAGKGMINSVCFTVDSPSTLKFWWVSGGDERQFALYDESFTELFKTQVESKKNSLYISSFPLEEAGTYYLGVPDGSNYLFKMEVAVGELTAERPPREKWENMFEPIIMSVEDDGKGHIVIEVLSEVGYNGGDELIAVMTDENGNECAFLRSTKESDLHEFKFSPEKSGEYSFCVSLMREGEEPYTSSIETCSFVLPLKTPSITGATSKGNGKALISYTKVPEADAYEIYAGGVFITSSSDTECLMEGFEIGSTVSFTVCALRNEEKSLLSEEKALLITEDEQREWKFVIYGPSTNTKDNGYIGNLNEDSFVTVYSENGKGKVQPNADDGVAFYYTEIPASMNFTLKADVQVDAWDYSNGQEGFGLMAMDSVPEMGEESYFTNQYMALASKIEYYFQNGKVSSSGTKYSMRLGLGVLAKLGRTDTLGSTIPGIIYPLETSAAIKSIEGVTNYNIIGNNTNPEILDKTSLSIQSLTDFTLEIQKNNTGYFVTYYAPDGSVIGQYKDYDPDALSVIDKENVYAGFFAARRARATFTNVTLTEITPQDDKAIEEKPVTKIQPTFSITSGETSNKQDYTLSLVSNVKGFATIKVDGDVFDKNLTVLPEIRNDFLISLPSSGESYIEVSFKPDENQMLPESTVLSSLNTLYAEIYITYTSAYASLPVIYVSPVGTPSGRGTIESPLNLSTAVKYASPGQTISLLDGVYNFVEPLRIPHGIDGTADLPIRMVADSSSASRPVLDFKQLSAGIIHGGDWWYFSGFDVTNTQNGQKGFQVSGHYNTLEDIETYLNGNTGIQISRYSGNDPVSEWPSHNLIINCTSWGNADAGYEDADGFAAKLTCGEGNVFDGCVAYNNADDGFDLYAKIETGPIGGLTIINSVAHSNGILPDGTIGGNGNGFKMGGSNIPGHHKLISSYAFFNRSKGIDSNSCPDLYVENCVSYNNLRYNVAFYTNLTQDTAYVANGLISFKDETIPEGDFSEDDELKPKGNYDQSAYLNETAYYWDGSASKNIKGNEITKDDFVSLTFTGITRNPDGSVNLNGFLELK